jgi:hypothetical protein
MQNTKASELELISQKENKYFDKKIINNICSVNKIKNPVVRRIFYLKR